MHSYLNSWNSPSRTEGLKELISNDYETVSISVDISGSCTLKVLWSNINTSILKFVDYGDTFSLNDNDYNFCVSKKAKYFYIKIENPTNITKLNVNTCFLKNIIKTSSDLSAVSATICYGKDPNNNDVALRLDSSGNLKTSSSGASGGDASSANQLLQIEQEELMNTKLQTLNDNVIKCDTDNVIVDTTAPLNTLLLGKVESTLNNAYLTVDSSQNLKVTVSNQNDISSLALESTQQDVKTILQNTFIEINEMKTEILNPTSIQPVTGVITIDNAFNLESTQQDIKLLTTDIKTELQNNLPSIDDYLNDINTTGAKDATSLLIKDELISLNNKDFALDSTSQSIDANLILINDKIATETTQQELKTLLTNQSAFNRFQTEAQVTDGKLDTVISNMLLTNFNVNNLTKCNTDSVIIQSGNVSVSGNVTVDNTSHLDVNCYGSSDGITFHHLKTNNNGVLSTNAIIETDNGTLTSTNESGYNALDVICKGTTNISGSVSISNFPTIQNTQDINIISCLETPPEIVIANKLMVKNEDLKFDGDDLKVKISNSSVSTNIKDSSGNSIIVDASGNLKVKLNNVDISTDGGTGLKSLMVNDATLVNIQDESRGFLSTIKNQTNKLTFDASNNLYINRLTQTQIPSQIVIGTINNNVTYRGDTVTAPSWAKSVTAILTYTGGAANTSIQFRLLGGNIITNYFGDIANSFSSGGYFSTDLLRYGMGLRCDNLCGLTSLKFWIYNGGVQLTDARIDYIFSTL